MGRVFAEHGQKRSRRIISGEDIKRAGRRLYDDVILRPDFSIAFLRRTVRCPAPLGDSPLRRDGLMFERCRGLSPSEALKGLLEREGVEKSSAILVLGSNALPAILWLCRQGFEHVCCLRPAASAPHEAADAVLIAHTCDSLGLKRLLGYARPLKTGGVLIFQLQGGDGTDQAAVDWLLRAYGFSLERQSPGAHRTLFIARRVALPTNRAA